MKKKAIYQKIIEEKNHKDIKKQDDLLLENKDSVDYAYKKMVRETPPFKDYINNPNIKNIGKSTDGHQLYELTIPKNNKYPKR